MDPDHLIKLAEQIAQIGGHRPRQVSLRRAVSTAYYAVFHALAAECVARTVGGLRSSGSWQVVTPIYRAIDHGAAKTHFRRLAQNADASEPLRQVARGFIELQEARIAADYDPSKRYTRREATDHVEQAKTAIRALRESPLEERLLLAVHLITKPR